VVCHRNVLEIAASIERRDALPAERTIAIWKRYMSAAIHHTRGARRVVVGYTSLFDRRERVLTDLAELVGRPDLASDTALRDQVDDWLEEGLRHHRSNTAETLAHPAMDAEARRLHMLLDLAAARGAVDPALDALASDIAAGE